MNTEIKNITILARRWFDKTYGNTYHSVKVYVDGKLIGTQPFAYGYGEGYLQSAVELLVKAGIYERDVEPDRVKGDTLIKGNDRTYWNMLNDMRTNRDKFVVDCVDVPRKKDLV